jgi:hypothetical protein
MLTDKLLGQLCGTSCAKDLESSRIAIKKACTAVTDVMIPSGSVAYPGKNERSSTYTLRC